jgi:hypothetical protein
MLIAPYGHTTQYMYSCQAARCGGVRLGHLSVLFCAPLVDQPVRFADTYRGLFGHPPHRPWRLLYEFPAAARTEPHAVIDGRAFVQRPRHATRPNPMRPLVIGDDPPAPLPAFQNALRRDELRDGLPSLPDQPFTRRKLLEGQRWGVTGSPLSGQPSSRVHRRSRVGSGSDDPATSASRS